MAWDEENPGCAPETCGGMRLDPCRTVLTTRGRWHDGEAPEAVADAVAVVLGEHLWFDEMGWCLCTGDDYTRPVADNFEVWQRHAAELAVAATTDWLRTRTSPALAGDPFILAGDWAADLLDGGRRDASR